MLIEKKCCKCGLVKRSSDFGINNAKRDGLQTHCRECKREYQNRWYHENKEKHIVNVNIRRRQYVRINRDRLNVYLMDHPCIHCGDTELLMLDFDHVRGVKRGAVSQLVSSGFPWKTILLEIAKCEVRCVRCHRRKTAAQFGWHQL